MRTQDEPYPETPDRASGSPADRRGSRRRTLALVATLPLVAILAGLLTIRTSWFISGRVEGILSEQIGGIVDVGSARYRGDGLFVLSDVTIRAPEVPGLPGEVIAIDRAEIQMDHARLRRFDAVPTSVSIASMRLRISERESPDDPGPRFSFLAFRPSMSSGDDPAPSVSIDEVELVVGTHRGTRWIETGSRRFQATLDQADGERGDSGWYRAVLQEIDERGIVDDRGRRIGVTGDINLVTFEHGLRIPRIDLGADLVALAPTAARAILTEMDPRGLVTDLGLTWDGTDFKVGFDAEDLGFRLPVQSGIDWARYRAGRVEPVGVRPRLRVVNGRFELDGEGLRLVGLSGTLAPSDAGGTVAEVPYRIDLDVRDLDLAGVAAGDPDAWVDRVLATAPFTLRFESRELRVGLGEGSDAAGDAIDLPAAVMSALGEFAFDRWRLSSELTVERAAPALVDGALVPGPVTVDGSATVRDAEGAYLAFAYPLTDLEADLTFDQRSLTVERVFGRGAGGAPVEIRGEVISPGADAEIRLTVKAAGIPVDDRLVAAFDDDIRGAIEMLRHVPTHEALAAARPEGGSAPFDGTLGGTVDLDLAIDREPGANTGTSASGLITLHDVDLLPAAFPYPMRATEGAIRLDAGSLRVAGPDRRVALRTAGGGHGFLTGEVIWAGEPIARPDVTISVRDDLIGPPLAAALPPSESEFEADPNLRATWPGTGRSRAARWLDRLGLAGQIRYEARLRGRPGEDGEDGEPSLAIDHDVEIAFEGLDADAAVAVALARGEAGIDDDERVTTSSDWSLQDLGGRLHVTPTRVDLDVHARHHDDRPLTVTGGIALDRERAVDLRIETRGVPVSDVLDDVIPADVAARLVDFRANHRPRGRLAADLRVHSDGRGDVRVSGEVVPSRVELGFEDGAVIGEHTNGGVRLEFGGGQPPSISFDELSLAIRDGDAAAESAPRPTRQRLDIDGRIRWPDSGATFDMEASWTGARLESPFLHGILGWVDAGPQRDRLRAFDARGALHMQMLYRTPDRIASGDGTAEPATWRIDVTPEVLSISVPAVDDDPAVPIAVTMSRGVLTFEPGIIRLDGLAGSNGALAIDADGIILTKPVLDADIAFDVTGPLLGRQVRTLLPSAVGDVLERIKLVETRNSRVTDARLRIRRPVNAPIDDDGALDIDFAGSIVLDDASLDIGVALGSVSGPFDLRLRRASGGNADLLIDARPTRLTVAGQRLRDIDAALHRDVERNMVVLDRFSARAGDGRVVIAGDIGTVPGSPWAVTVDVSAIPIGDFDFKTSRADAPEAGAEAAPPLELSGDLYGQLAIGGRIGVDGSILGRGSAIVTDADLFEIPGLLSLVQMVQLTLPADRYDFASAEFFLSGPHLHFEEVYLESNTAMANAHALSATGSVDLDDGSLEGRVRSRSGVIAPLREMVGAIGDAVASIEVAGTLREPEFNVELLGGDAAGRRGRLARPVRLMPKSDRPREPITVADADDDGGTSDE